MSMPLKYEKGTQVRLTDPENDYDFRVNKFNDFAEEWKIFWNEYKNKPLFVVGVSETGGIYLQPLPDYVDHDTPFYSDEIEGIVDTLPEELFHV